MTVAASHVPEASPRPQAGTGGIRVASLAKSFRVPHERYSSLKERVLNPFASSRYEVLDALRDVSFEVGAGECFGIVGRNGSGKSTLLRCIAGIYPPDSGTIAVTGRLAPFIELGIGFHPELAARENAVTNAIMLGLSRKDAEERFPDMLAFAELERFVDQPLKNYSTGMSARLAFAVTIHVDADVLLFDEVFAVGDGAFQKKCAARFEQLRDEGKTIVVVTHDMSLIRRYCDRALALQRGELVEIGDPETVAERYEQLNEGRDVASRPAPRPAPELPPKRPRSSLLGPDLRRFLTLTHTLAVMNIRLKYVGTAGNYLWALARPLAMFGVLLLVFTKLGRFNKGVPDYSTYLLMSIVLWTLFSQTTATSVNCLVNRASFLRRLPFPHLAVPLSVMQSALFDLGPNFLVVVVFALASGVSPQLGWIELPFLVLILTVLTTGVSLLLSALFVRFRDVNQVWLVVSQSIFYLTPIFYVAASLPDRLERAVVLANPVATILTEARHAFVDPDAPTAAAAAGGAVYLLVPLTVIAVMFALGLWAFRCESGHAAENV